MGRTVELVAVVDADMARAHVRADAYGIPAVYPSVEDMFAAHRLDAVDIMTPPASHAAHCSAAAAAGVAILCQKPLAPSWQEANAIARDVGDRVRLMVHENWRFRPHYRQIAAWLHGGHIGAWRSCTIDVRSSGLLADATGQIPALQRQPLLARLPRLMVAEVLVHHIDLALWLLGDLQVCSAWVRRQAPEVIGESAAQIVLQDHGGRRVVLDGGMADKDCSPVLRDTVSIQGDNGTIVLEHDRLMLRGERSEDQVIDVAADYQRS
jgi:predicted dehydrogenase